MLDVLKQGYVHDLQRDSLDTDKLWSHMYADHSR